MDEGDGALAGRGGGEARESPDPRWPRKQREDAGIAWESAREGSRLHAGAERGRGEGRAGRQEGRHVLRIGRAVRHGGRSSAPPNATSSFMFFKVSPFKAST